MIIAADSTFQNLHQPNDPLQPRRRMITPAGAG
jgi:hypothetical protein